MRSNSYNVSLHYDVKLRSLNLHFNLESIVHLSDIALTLRRTYNVIRVNKFFFFFAVDVRSGNASFVNHALTIFYSIFFLFLQLSLFHTHTLDSLTHSLNDKS